MASYTKQRADAPGGFFALEAAGLRWLAVPGGVQCARVLAVRPDALLLERLEASAPTPRYARDFGARLAVLHDAGAEAFGAGPPGWTGDGYFGPLAAPLPVPLRPYPSWGRFYAQARLAPMVDRACARGLLSRGDELLLRSVVAVVQDGTYDDDEPPARLHGDLWSGNVLWTAAGAVLIDPAAHGGHRETDLAMLALFGLPHLAEVLAAYRQVHPLVAGWEDRIRLHQLFPLLVHAILFGGGYLDQALDAARCYA